MFLMDVISVKCGLCFKSTCIYCCIYLYVCVCKQDCLKQKLHSNYVQEIISRIYFFYCIWYMSVIWNSFLWDQHTCDFPQDKRTRVHAYNEALRVYPVNTISLKCRADEGKAGAWRQAVT